MRIYRTYLPFSSNQCTCLAYFFDPFLFFTTLFSLHQKIRSSHLLAHLALTSHGTTEPFTKNLQLPFQELSRHPCMYVAGESLQILAGSSWVQGKTNVALKRLQNVTSWKVPEYWMIYISSEMGMGHCRHCQSLSVLLEVGKLLICEWTAKVPWSAIFRWYL